MYKEILINKKKTTNLFKEFLIKIKNKLVHLQEILIKVDKAENKRKRLIYQILVNLKKVMKK